MFYYHKDFKFEKDETLKTGLYYITKIDGSNFVTSIGIEMCIDSLVVKSPKEVKEYLDKTYYNEV